MAGHAFISPVNFIEALSLALDLTSTGLSAHHSRTAVIAYRMACELGLNQPDLRTLTYAAFLHDIGAAANWDEREDFLKFQQTGDIYQHAEIGYDLLKKSQYFGHIADVIRHHHDRYDGGNPSGTAGESIPLLSRILFMAGGIDTLQRQKKGKIFEMIPQVIHCVQEASGSCFDPTLVAVFLKIAKREGFWLDILTGTYNPQFIRELKFNKKIPLASEDMIHIASIFASLVDSTSRFTFHHSHNVAAVTGFLASAYGYSEDKVGYYKLAGLLHDLGKLAVPNAILEKPGRLSSRECFDVKRHPYFTLRILQRIEGFGMVADWAGHHHEMPNGCGYPFGIGGKSLSHGARMIAVADVYSALNENRPYRSSLDADRIARIIKDKARAGELDAKIVADLIAQQEAVQIALQNSVMDP
ncbi:MAG TPA: HD domain-containing phosphohydrolase [Patescibacteria group bacterium]|nr:HD domain-containing phosphohydrolase [Patescibacteria group bacterium]